MNTQTFNISLPRELVKRVDQLAKKEYRSRSSFIREALRIYLIKAEEENRIFARCKK
jgi:metal-responsive CopG/Arc/MetJ family transcriptional regulator